MKNKFWLLLVAFLLGVIGCYAVVEIKNSGNTYVVDIDGKLKVYKPELTEKDAKEFTAIADKIVADYYEREVKGKYCIAEMTMSGEWSDTCYDTKKECESELKYWLKQESVFNAKKCYQASLVKAWCLYHVQMANHNYSNDGSVANVYENICTKDKSLCEQLEHAQHPLRKTGCIYANALSHESSAPYVWSDKEVKEAIEQTKNLTPVVFGK